MRLLQGYRVSCSPTAMSAYDGVAEALQLVHAGCMAHCPPQFDEARKAQPESCDATPASHWSSSRKLYRIERRCGNGASRHPRAAACHARAKLRADHGRVPRLARGARPEGVCRRACSARPCTTPWVSGPS